MIAWAMAIRPPPPIPWMARNAISSTMLRDRPDRIEPATKITMANWNRILRPSRSLILPYSGTETVEVNR